MALCSYCKKEITSPQYKTFKKKKYHYDCFNRLVTDVESNSAMQQKIATKSEKEKTEFDNLISYICNLFSIEKPTSLIEKQIADFKKKYGYTYTGMQETLRYFYELGDNKISKEQITIGIIPYLYDEAKRFAYNSYQINEKNMSAEIIEKTNKITINPKDRKIPYAVNIEDL